MRRISIPYLIRMSLLTPLMTASFAHASIPKDAATKEAKIAVAIETPAPPIGWLKWKTFDKLYFGKLQGEKLSDEQRLAALKKASLALDSHLTALTPDQLLRVIATMETEAARLEALAELVTSTRYNNDDISKITASFSQMKGDARALLIAVGGYGGY